MTIFWSEITISPGLRPGLTDEYHNFWPHPAVPRVCM
jgi:hypothetical protein